MRTIENGTFPIHAYPKRELAECYFPDAPSSHAAVAHLMAWVKGCRPLWEKLQEGGYNKNAKYFNSKEVLLIVSHLGEP